MNNQSDNNINSNVNGIPANMNNAMPVENNNIQATASQNNVVNPTPIPNPAVGVQPNEQFQPINSIPVQNQQVDNQNVQPIESQMSQNQQVNNNESIQNQLQSIPTIEQSNQNFVASTQTISAEKSVESKKKVNYLLIIILLAVVFGVVFFVFPLLKNII